jgi:hypothetical protein
MVLLTFTQNFWRWVLVCGLSLTLFWPLLSITRPASVTAQSGNARASQTCFAEVKWNYLTNLRRGPGTNFGIKRQMRWGTEMRVFGRDAEGEWWQVHVPEVDMVGWLWEENINLYGKCDTVPDNSNNPEPASAPSPPPAMPIPEFAVDIEFSEHDRVFYLNDGMIYVRRTVEEPELMQAHMVIADLAAPQLDVQVTVGAEPLVTNKLVSEMARENEALVAINGDFYGGNYLPQSLTVVDGEVITSPKFRATFALTEDHEAFIGYFTRAWTWDGSVVAENDAFIPLQLANQPCDPAWMCLYTDFLGEMRVAYGYDGLRVLLDEDFEVVEINENQYFKIPEGHYVLRAGSYSPAGQWIRDHVEVGDTLEVNLTTDPPWQDYEYAVSGGPIIVEDGEFRQDCDPEIPEAERVCEEFDDLFRSIHYFDVHIPRSAVGLNAEGNVLYLVMVEGYEVDHSGGITQRDLAEVFVELGAETAMEFDGGGSSGLWIGDGHVNDFGARGERRVTNALLLFWEE